MQVEVATDIDADPGRVWSVMADVETWPEWTRSMQRVRRLDGGPLALGSRAEVKQPMLPQAVWRVTSLDEGEGFVWESDSLGVHTIGAHRVEPRGEGSRAILTIRMTGGLTPLFAPLTRPFVRRYMRMEAAGLKRRAEEFRA
jgi:uncharacterized membrane protein